MMRLTELLGLTRRRRPRVAAALATAALSGLAVAPAYADPVPGATYNGVAADGAQVQLTVSSDGTLVDSYHVNNAPGSTCSFYGAGESAVWPGAPIAGGAFEYQFDDGSHDTILFGGTFPGAQSAAGTFRFYDPPAGGRPACDTGTVSWTATTTARPPAGASGGNGTTGGGGPGTSGHTGGNGKRAFITRVVLRTLSKVRLGGRLSSSNASCRAGRTVILWRGQRRIESIRSKKNGTYAFTRPALWRGRMVRATATARRLPHNAGTCAAGSSTFIKA